MKIENIVSSVGRRKTAIARVWLKPGTGVVTVNNLPLKHYFSSNTKGNVETMQSGKVLEPFIVTGKMQLFDVKSTVKGGGLMGQAEALRHAIAKAIDSFDKDCHSVLRSAGLLTRDSRIVERKKYGLHKARKSTQFSKR